MKKISLLILQIFSLPSLAFQAVDLNSASVEQIALLPGIGEKLAKNLVSFRHKHGSLSGVENLRSVEGMTEKKLLALKNTVVFGETLKKTKKNTPAPWPEPVPKVSLAVKPLINLAQLEISVLIAMGLKSESDHSLAHRARRAAYLPKLTAFVDMEQANITTRKIMEVQTGSRMLRGNQDIGFGIRVVFDLDKLIFNSDELEIAKLSLKRLEKREEIIAKLHQYYFRYKHLLETIKNPLEAPKALLISSEMEEIAAKIDAMSGGEFTRHQSMVMMDEVVS